MNLFSTDEGIIRFWRFSVSLPFTSLHGDFIMEIFNGQTKCQAGSHIAGFSTDRNKVNDWVKTAHIHAK